MSKDVIKNILEEYQKSRPRFSKLTHELEDLVNKLLKGKGIKMHPITSRTKDMASLSDKINRLDKDYKSLKEITDLSGVRIITYFEDDVKKVAEIIEKEFEIDREKSVDKLQLMDPNRFGYLSLHYVAKLDNTSEKPTEYERFADDKFEIQIRSMLQHTWAEIVHDLGYKNKESVPRVIERRFFRLAGLLELGDSEFVEIRNQLAKYEKNVSKEITTSPKSVMIDQASLHAFAKGNSIVRELDKKIASIASSRLTNPLGLGGIIERLNYFDIETIADISKSLKKYDKIVELFAKNWISGSSYKIMPGGISLYFLCDVMAAEKGRDEFLTYIDTMEIGFEEDRSDFATKVLLTYNQVLSDIKGSKES